MQPAYMGSHLSSSTNMVSSPSYGTKFGSSYTASSAYTNNKRPMLFKSSKYVINKTEEASKD